MVLAYKKVNMFAKSWIQIQSWYVMYGFHEKKGMNCFYSFFIFQVKNCHSHWEISYILKDSFQKLATFRDAEIRRWYGFSINIMNHNSLYCFHRKKYLL